MKKTILRKYAQLIAARGVNVQKGQEVFIVAALDQPEFVQMVVAHDPSRPCQVVVALVPNEFVLVAVLVDGHTSELIDVEGLATQSDALLPEDGRASVLPSDSDVADEHKRREEDEAERGYAEVDGSFHVL